MGKAATPSIPSKAKKSKVHIRTTAKGDTERYVGTPNGSYLVKTNMDVDVPADVREAIALSDMQQQSVKETIEKFELKSND